MNEVKAALKRIKQGKSIKGLKLGHYTVTSYDGEILNVGCHHFRQTEVDWLMEALNI